MYDCDFSDEVDELVSDSYMQSITRDKLGAALTLDTSENLQDRDVVEEIHSIESSEVILLGSEIEEVLEVEGEQKALEPQLELK